MQISNFIIFTIISAPLFFVVLYHHITLLGFLKSMKIHLQNSQKKEDETEKTNFVKMEIQHQNIKDILETHFTFLKQKTNEILKIKDIVDNHESFTELKSQILNLKKTIATQPQNTLEIAKKSHLKKEPAKIKWNKNLNFVINTKERKNGFEYLLKTLNSIKNTFKPYDVEIKIFVYGEKDPALGNDVIFDSIEKDKELETIAIKLGGERTVPNQTLDWIAMMMKWNKICKSHSNSIFFLMEDDFEFCKGATVHWFLAYFWALKNKSKWYVLRTGIGLSGLFLQCRDILEIVSYLKLSFLRNPFFPHDTKLAKFWSPYFSHQQRVHYTYKYNLFDHIGIISSISNNEKRNVDCLAPNVNFFLHWYEQYDLACSYYLFSPCRNKKIHRDYDLPMNPLLEAGGNLKLKTKLMNILKVKIIINQDTSYSCQEVCTKNEMICIDDNFFFANSPVVARRVYLKDLWVIERKEILTAFETSNRLLVPLDSRKSKCETKYNEKSIRVLCPCSLKS